MSRSPNEYLKHIIDETEYLIREVVDVSQAEFIADETLKRAFVRSIEIIGEAAKHLPHNLTEKHANIEWKAIAGMRDRLIHEYFGVDYEIVWDVVTNKIPELHREITAILNDFN